MVRSIRPTSTFVLRLWREPGEQESDRAWRGMIRPLESKGGPREEQGELFHGLENLLEALRPYLEEQDRSDGPA